MLLRTSPTSPFVRKVLTAALMLDIPLEREVTNTTDPADSIRQQNPLGKIPTLITDDGMEVFDSRVILAYLDQAAGGGRLIPTDPKARIAALRLEALADGLMDAGILVLYEGRFRPQEKHEERWLTHQRGKMARALTALEELAPEGDFPITVGEISLACALGFLDFRFAGAWRADAPRLVAFAEAFGKRVPGFAGTAPKE